MKVGHQSNQLIENQCREEKCDTSVWKLLEPSPQKILWRWVDLKRNYINQFGYREILGQNLYSKQRSSSGPLKAVDVYINVYKLGILST